MAAAAVGMVLTGAPAALAQGAPAVTEPARVMVVGTYHFANPGLDVVKTEVADVLSPVKQREIGAVVEALARFGPTRIAVEQEPSTAPVLDSLYTAYLAGQHTLSRNETQQLGFRLAARFGHPRVHPIDHPGAFPFGAVMEYAQAHDPGFVALVAGETARIAEEANREQRELSIGQILRRANDPARLARAHGLYMTFARVGAGDGYVGATLVARWYERNIRMFANLQRVAEPGERVLLIVGSGHAPILRELVSYDPEMILVETLDYLAEDGG